MPAYYERSNLDRIPELARLAPQAAAAYFSFEHQVYNASDVIPAKVKELIAVAVAHVTGCPYCIDVHVKKCKELGGTREEIFAAVLVAASTRAGAVLSHATHALIAFDETSASSSVPANPDGNPPAAPDCFC